MKLILTTKLTTHGLWAGLLLAGTLLASAVPVTFRVNMEYQITQGNFHPDVDFLEVRGAFQSPDTWAGGFVLTNVPGTMIYQGTYDVTNTAPGKALEFKYVVNALIWESINNRSFILDNVPQMLPVLYFNDQWAGSVAIPVTFQVNLGAQIARGAFHPATDFVESRGTFNDWNGGFVLTNSPADTNVYLGTWDYSLKPPGAKVEYKFILNSNDWESINNRTFIMPDSPMTLPAVWFDNQTGSVVKAAVSFQLDMNVQVALDFFDKANDEAWVDGNYLGWGDPPDGLQLFEDSSRPGIYTNLFTTTNLLTDAPLHYKFVIWHTNLQSKVWETGPDKVLPFDGTEPTNADGFHLKVVGPVPFNGQSLGDVLSEDTLVTFRVSMTNAIGTDGVVFDPMANGVWINGDFLGWWSWGSMPLVYMMTCSDPEILTYEWQWMFPKGSPVRVEYKFGIDSRDDEALFSVNHVGYIQAVGSYVMPIDTFSSMLQEPAVGILSAITSSNGWLNLSWNGRPGIHLQSATNLAAPMWLDLTNTEGSNSLVMPLGGDSRFFRLVKP